MVEPRGRSGGMLIFWEEHVKMHQLIRTYFCIEAEIEGTELEGRFWAIFIYASTDIILMKEQWEISKEEREKLGSKMGVAEGGRGILMT